ncbi:MAG: methyltransferase, partial [Alphaproteobacteria bacterium]
MSEALWSQVDEYIVDRLVKEDAALAAALAANAAAGLPAMDVSAAQGKFLNLMVRITGARTVLELGTLGGYSTIWMAKALPADGRLVTLEYEPRHAEVARKNIDVAGVGDKVTIHVGAAVNTLPVVATENNVPFDFI